MIKQTIKYPSSNTYFAGFLQEIIDESAIKGSVEQKKNEIVLCLDDKDEEALKKFSELTTKYLPHSFFIEDIKTEVIEGEVTPLNFVSKPYDIGLCPRCLEAIKDPASSHYLDDSLVCTHYKNKPFYSNDTTIFSPHYSEGSSILVCDSSKVDELFILTDEEKKLLFSIEKPTIKVTIKSDEIKEFTGRDFIDIKAPYNTRSTLAAINAKDADMPYIFFHDCDDLKVVKVQKNTVIVRAKRVAKELENLNEDKTLNRFLNLCKEADYEKAVAANLDTKGISFLVKNDMDVKEVLKFSEFNLEKTLKKMQEDEIRSKLLANFSKKYPEILERMQSEDLGFYETLSLLLDVKEKGFNGLSEKALLFRGNGGLKVDIFFDDEGVDYPALLGSMMSFKLAGADDYYIAYSFFEAVADTAITTLTQLKTKFAVPNSVMMGDMFSNSVLFSRILSKYSLSNPYFSKVTALSD